MGFKKGANFGENLRILSSAGWKRLLSKLMLDERERKL